MSVEVTVEDIRTALDDYPDLKDSKIVDGIDQAKGTLYGVNPDWENHGNAYRALKKASIAQTLILHFPHDANNFQYMMQEACEMVASLWSSSFMLKRKSGFCRGFKPSTSNTNPPLTEL